MRTPQVRGDFRIFDKMVLMLWITIIGQVKGQSNRCPSGVDETGTDGFCCRIEFLNFSGTSCLSLLPVPGTEFYFLLMNLAEISP